VLIHKSIDVRREVWTRLKVNAELSGVALRDYLSYLALASGPVDPAESPSRQALDAEVRRNGAARQGDACHS
jgi:macrodomain Ter protein organizer (MatP/YcbG family)